MTRPVDRRLEVRIGAGAAGQRDDRSLWPGISVNGAPPRIRKGDTWQSVARVKCAECSTVGVVWMVTRPGRDPLPVAELQVVEDWTARPVVARTARVEVRPGSTFTADCPAHGAVDCSADDALDAARRGAVAVLKGAERAAILNVRPSGRRDPMPAPNALPLDELNEWLGWSDTPAK